MIRNATIFQKDRKHYYPAWYVLNVYRRQLMHMTTHCWYNLDDYTLPRLYQAMGRPHLEYGIIISPIQMWCTSCRKGTMASHKVCAINKSSLWILLSPTPHWPLADRWPTILAERSMSGHGPHADHSPLARRLLADWGFCFNVARRSQGGRQVLIVKP